MRKKFKRVELPCQVCGNLFTGPEPEVCCSGRECGCMGQPIEPMVCSDQCYDDLINHRKLYMQKIFMFTDKNGEEYVVKAESEAKAKALLISKHGDLGFEISAAQG